MHKQYCVKFLFPNSILYSRFYTNYISILCKLCLVGFNCNSTTVLCPCRTFFKKENMKYDFYLRTQFCYWSIIYWKSEYLILTTFFSISFSEHEKMSMNIRWLTLIFNQISTLKQRFVKFDFHHCFCIDSKLIYLHRKSKPYLNNPIDKS